MLVLLLAAGAVCAESPSVPAQTAPSAQPPVPLTLLLNAQELVRAKNYGAALGILSSYKPSPEERSAYHTAFAQALGETGKTSESIEHLRLAYLFAPSDDEKARLLLERGDAYGKIGFYAEAALCYELFLKNFPRSPLNSRGHLGLADTRYRLGQFSDALRHYEQAGPSSHALYGKANALQALGMVKDAHEIYLALLPKDRAYVDGSEETRYAVAENFRQAGRIQDAKIYYNSLSSPPFKAKAEMGLGMIALAEGAPDAALQHLAGPSQSSDRGVRCQALFLKAEASLRAGNQQEAVNLFQEIKTTCPFGKEQDSATLMLARMYKNAGRYDEAVALIKGLVFRRAPDADALDELESMVLDAARKDQAGLLALWNATGQWLLDPSRSASLVTVARGLRGTGRPFLEVCRWLLKHGTDESKAEARLLLAEFYADLGDGPTAVRYLQRADKKKGSDEYQRIRAKAYAAGKDYDQAADALLSIKNAGESDIMVLLDLAGSMKKKNVEKVLAFSEHSLKNLPASIRAYLRYADLQYEVGRYTEARKYYEAALSGAAKQDGPSGMTAQEREWARYRLLLLTEGNVLPGPRTAAAPAPQQKSAGIEGRLLEADRKGREISQRMKKVL